jgi:hypothetical protein
MTSSERSSRFRSDVMARDGSACVFTAVEATLCDAAHLLPKSKGDEVCIQHCCSMLMLLNASQYIGVVFEDRRNLYDTALEPANLDINSVENGMMLRKDLHASFAVGNCAFLKVYD